MIGDREFEFSYDLTDLSEIRKSGLTVPDCFWIVHVSFYAVALLTIRLRNKYIVVESGFTILIQYRFCYQDKMHCQTVHYDLTVDFSRRALVLWISVFEQILSTCFILSNPIFSEWLRYRTITWLLDQIKWQDCKRICTEVSRFSHTTLFTLTLPGLPVSFLTGHLVYKIRLTKKQRTNIMMTRLGLRLMLGLWLAFLSTLVPQSYPEREDSLSFTWAFEFAHISEFQTLR